MDLTSIITADGTYSLRVSDSVGGADYSSKEGANSPKLLVSVGGASPQSCAGTGTATPTPGPSSTPTNTPTAGPSPTPTTAPSSTPTSPPSAPFNNATFVYDGDGKRVKSTFNGTTTTYFVGTHYEVTGSTITKYYYAGAQRIAMRSNGALNYLLGDHLGSTSLTTDANGQVVAELRYRAWGETRYSSGTTPTDYQYTGQYSYAGDFGLLFYNARWYDPYLNHFTQPDTIVPDPNNPQDWNRYSYARYNPVRYTDPTGHRVDDGCRTEGCNLTSLQKAIDAQKLAKLNAEAASRKCANGNRAYCSGYQNAKGGLINFLTHTTIALDTTSAIISFFEAGIADLFIGGTLLLTAVQPELAPMIGEALLLDFAIASPINPLGALENVLGSASFGTTAVADLLSGNTYISNNTLYVGKDTIVAGRNMYLGMIPEANVDLAVSVSQLNYDMDRLNGVRPGGSIEISKANIDGVVGQLLWYDSPLQDFVNFLLSP